jgi:hypothetical protein
MGYQQRLGESAPTVARIISNLTYRGMELKGLPYRPRNGVVILANGFDRAAAKDLADFLGAMGVKTIMATPAEFETLRYNSRLVVLGGQNSPEGVGQVSSAVLSTEDEDHLLQTGAQAMFVKEGSWATRQKVIVLAGNEASDTANVASEKKDRVLEEVKQ